jgi:hypothetical protein
VSFRFFSLSALAVLSASACGSSGPHAPASAADLQAPPEHGGELSPVQAGAYRLQMSAICSSSERTLTGQLTLKPISGAEVARGVGATPPSDGLEDGVLLWGQTDLDFEKLRSCLTHSTRSAEEPIHPSVLVEVLKWDGEPHHQVLLVATEPGQPGPLGLKSGGGVAMWVERVEQGHLAGVWSRWELVGQREGRWRAELLNPE